MNKHAHHFQCIEGETSQPAILDECDQRGRAELKLCEALEDVADRLPAICPERYAQLATALRVVGTQRVLETVAKQLQAECKEGQAGSISVCQQLGTRIKLIAEEERQDADLAMELADALEIALQDHEAFKPDALGYLMRNFFEIRRRHLAWRREAFLNPACKVMEAQMFTQLVEPLNKVDPKLCVITLLQKSDDA